MLCAEYREAASARLDGEPPGLPAGEMDEHLGGCSDCTAWQAAAQRVTRLVRLAPAPDIPDLSAQVLAALLPRRHRSTRRSAGWALGRDWPAALLRVGIAVVALGQVAVGWPALALGSETMGAPLHVAHESGSWNLALAVALLVVARRPRYAPGLMPMLGAFVAVLAVFSVPDIAAGHVPSARIGDHLLLVGGLVLVAALAHRVRGPVMPPVDGRGGSGDGRSGAGGPPGPIRPRPAIADSHLHAEDPTAPRRVVA
jgi:predicted anti-sigma-YlaC factor YlaD